MTLVLEMLHTCGLAINFVFNLMTECLKSSVEFTTPFINQFAQYISIQKLHMQFSILFYV
jgi:hypothetical protein